MRKSFLAVLVLLAAAQLAPASNTQPQYYAHATKADKNGVIAPWYTGQNGQFDYRVRIAAETMKRYPWATRERAVMPAPEYLYNGTWSIDHEGRITAPEEGDSANGDLGQRAGHIISGLMEYYRYSGDPAALTPIYLTADYLVNYCQTDANHGWPRVLISVPTHGKRYGACALGPSEDFSKFDGKIQLDLVAEVGYELVRAYEMTGNRKWYDAAKHWADLLAQNRRREPGVAPWGRYANNSSGNGMNGTQTGGIAYILMFFDELIRTGYTGTNNSIVEARDDARRYLREVLLPAWLANDTWGRSYWDWEQPTQGENVTDYTVQYMLNNKEAFPNWKNDVRNLLGVFLNHTSVSPGSSGDTFHGAWAFPEAANCCGRSLWYGPLELGGLFARYGVESDSEWAREIGRRSEILSTYDPLADGQVMDSIDGGSTWVARQWFKIAHPMALKHVLRAMAWMPEITGANRENHIMRSSAVVQRVFYGKDRIEYSTFDAPQGTIEVLRLSYVPASVTANKKQLGLRKDLQENGYTVSQLPGGDAIVAIRHDGATEVAVSGTDPQKAIDAAALGLDKLWRTAPGARLASQAGAGFTATFTGNQVRLLAPVGPKGGYADVYIDDFKQVVPVDFYSPVEVDHQVLYYRNGLTPGKHTLKLVARGARNPLSQGDEVYVQSIQYSDATGESGFGEGGGPKETQRMIFGYPLRTDFRDSQGDLWRPATEFVVRTGSMTDSVAKSWWTMPQAVILTEPKEPGVQLNWFDTHVNFPDAPIYAYGAHWRELWTNLTVAPGKYHVRLKFAETQYQGPGQRSITIRINGSTVVDGFDICATAGHANMGVDLVFNDVEPKNGVIEVRLIGNAVRGEQREAIIQALEVGPGDGGTGAVPKILR